MLLGKANDSCNEMVGKVKGRPPAMVTPRLIAETSLGAEAWQGLKSLAVWAIPTTGRSSASPVRP